jgi:hypothetical protein
MTKLILALAALTAALIVGLAAWRWSDKSADRAVWASLASQQLSAPATFDLSMIAELPEAAQRFLRFAIRPGTPLYTVAEISVEGEFSLGNRSDPD